MEEYELCEKVYELFPHWDDVDHWAAYEQSDIPKGKILVPVIGFNCPIYTSDYLLEKLPSPLIQHWGGEPIGFQLQLIDASSQTEKSWVAQYWHSDEMTEGLSEADTPLKALLKLTLALHEAGELK